MPRCITPPHPTSILTSSVQWKKAKSRRDTDRLHRNLNRERWRRLFRARCLFGGLNLLEVTPLLRSFAALIDTLGIALTRMFVAYKLATGDR